MTRAEEGHAQHESSTRAKRPRRPRTDEIRLHLVRDELPPAAHGSAVFTARGETQGAGDRDARHQRWTSKVKDEVLAAGHRAVSCSTYTLPSLLSTGEARPHAVSPPRDRPRPPAWRALKPMIRLARRMPTPYAFVSDNPLESNGSSSMAHGMRRHTGADGCRREDEKPVSGIAMGLILNDSETGRWPRAFGHLGDEAHLGDMDFQGDGHEGRHTATQHGHQGGTASVRGCWPRSLEQARVGRMHILGKLTAAYAEPARDTSPSCRASCRSTIPAGYDRRP